MPWIFNLHFPCSVSQPSFWNCMFVFTSQSGPRERSPPPSKNDASEDMDISPGTHPAALPFDSPNPTVTNTLATYEISPTPTSGWSLELEGKLANFHSLRAQGTYFNDSLLRNKAFRNPNIYPKLVQLLDIDETGTGFRKEVWDAEGFKRSGCDSVRLGEMQKEREEEREREKKRDREKGAGIRFVTSSTRDGDDRDDDGKDKKKSRWDQPSRRKEKEKDREKDRARERDRDRESYRDRDRDRERRREKERERSPRRR
ncbi:HCNGP-domain-containing protein [Atractiella rhizophila]|nr:HCNGP-domain-containing protein [Atractiella rhizophila]